MSEDLIKAIQELVDSGKADAGRLRYILHTIEKGKTLYNSDRKYLERLISVPAQVAPQIEKPHVPLTVEPVAQPTVQTTMPPNVEPIIQPTVEPARKKTISNKTRFTTILLGTLAILVMLYLSGYLSDTQKFFLSQTPLQEKLKSIIDNVMSVSVEGFFVWLSSLSFWDLIKILIFPVVVDYTRSFGKSIFLLAYAILKEKKKKKMLASYKPNLKISLLIPAHNEEGGIRGAIEAALATTYQNKEIIVIDDGSTDMTYQIAQEYAAKKLIKVIRRKEASGSKAVALNYAASYATGDIFMSIDGDTLIERKSLEEIVKNFHSDKVIAVSGNVRILSGDNGVTNFLTRLQSYEYLVNMELGRRYNAILNSLLIISGAFGAFRREVFTGVGMYDKDTITEDFDLTVKVKKFKGKLEFATDAIAWTYCPNNWKAWWRQRFRWSQGQMRTLLKHKDIMWTTGFDFPLIVAVYDMWIMDIILLVARFVWFPVLFWQFTANLAYLFILLFTIYMASEAFVAASAAILSPRKGDLKLVYLSPVIVTFYRPLMSLLRFKAYVSALIKKEADW